MKLRINKNSVRLRLSQLEVKSIDEKGEVQCELNLGSGIFRYRLVKQGNVITTDYSKDCISIAVPEKVISDWTRTDQVGIDHQITLHNNEVLSVLIEKDFKCLTDRPHEDESDLFQNPLDKHSC